MCAYGGVNVCGGIYCGCVGVCLTRILLRLVVVVKGKGETYIITIFLYLLSSSFPPSFLLNSKHSHSFLPTKTTFFNISVFLICSLTLQSTKSTNQYSIISINQSNQQTKYQNEGILRRYCFGRNCLCPFHPIKLDNLNCYSHCH